MKDPEIAKLEGYCEELHAALDKIKAIVWEPKTTLPAVKRKVAVVVWHDNQELASSSPRAARSAKA